MTRQGRRQRIVAALAARADQPPDLRETLLLTLRSKQELFPVVELDLDVVLLNARSHRLRSWLESHPRANVVATDPWSPDAQMVVADLIRKAHRNFEQLQQNLDQEGQLQPGVITRDGILINANSRAVALRDLADQQRRWIRVAVLPADVEARELAALELRLQMQEELKDDYTLTNEMLFIEEMARVHGFSSEQLAIALRWSTTDPLQLKKGAARVEQQRRVLALLREMQHRSDPVIPITFFDDKLEQLKALEQKYRLLSENDPEVARRFRDNWLLVALAGAESVHDLRSVDEHFVEAFLIPRLGEQVILRDHVDAIFSPSLEQPPPLPGLDALDPTSSQGAAVDFEVGRALNILASPASASPSVTMPDGVTLLDRAEVVTAIRSATRLAIADEKAEDRAESRLSGPADNLRAAARHIQKAMTTYSEIRGNPEFERTKRADFTYNYNRVRKLSRKLEDLVLSERQKNK